MTDKLTTCLPRLGRGLGSPFIIDRQVEIVWKRYGGESRGLRQLLAQHVRV
jgi:hypothetical protein